MACPFECTVWVVTSGSKTHLSSFLNGYMFLGYVWNNRSFMETRWFNAIASTCVQENWYVCQTLHVQVVILMSTRYFCLDSITLMMLWSIEDNLELCLFWFFHHELIGKFYEIHCLGLRTPTTIKIHVCKVWRVVSTIVINNNPQSLWKRSLTYFAMIMLLYYTFKDKSEILPIFIPLWLEDIVQHYVFYLLSYSILIELMHNVIVEVKYRKRFIFLLFPTLTITLLV